MTLGIFSVLTGKLCILSQKQIIRLGFLLQLQQYQLSSVRHMCKHSEWHLNADLNVNYHGNCRRFETLGSPCMPSEKDFFNF